MAVIEYGYSIPGYGGEFAAALRELYRLKNISVEPAAVIAWAYCGELYLAHFLCGLSSARMRSEQYAAKEWHGNINMECSDYDELYCLLAGCADAVGVCLHLPDEGGGLHETWVERQLILDMFDFCRDGIG